MKWITNTVYSSDAPPRPLKSCEHKKKYFCIHELTNISVNIREAFKKQKKNLHFCQGLKQHHKPKQDELDTSDLSLDFNYF